MAFHVLALVLDLVAAPSCVRGPGGQVACGYNCTSNLDKLACAQTPDGLCVSTPSRVVCWDPPPDVRILMAGPRRDELPRPGCLTSVNDAACGFYCVRAAGRVRCADTPFGACATRFSIARCWDPAPEVRWAMSVDDRLQRAGCERTLDDVACGYHCVATADQIRCAATPWGMCERKFDALACWDPPVLYSGPGGASSSPQY